MTRQEAEPEGSAKFSSTGGLRVVESESPAPVLSFLSGSSINTYKVASNRTEDTLIMITLTIITKQLE